MRGCVLAARARRLRWLQQEGTPSNPHANTNPNPIPTPTPNPNPNRNPNPNANPNPNPNPNQEPLRLARPEESIAIGAAAHAEALQAAQYQTA